MTMTKRVDLINDNGLDPALAARLTDLIEEGHEIFHQFDLEVRTKNWHPFMPANYDRVLQRLIEYYKPGMRFLEWGSATGIITIMADMLGYESYGIELDGELVRTARMLADKYQSNARFAAGSFMPMGYVWRDSTGDNRMGTLGQGDSGYVELKHPLEDFDLVFGYAWDGEMPIMEDVMRCYGGADARLILHGNIDTEVHKGVRRPLP